MSKFSTGPWRVENGVHIFAEDPYGRGRMHIADIRGWGHLIGVCRFGDNEATDIYNANGRLMGAGPRLYDLLKQARERLFGQPFFPAELDRQIAELFGSIDKDR